MPQWTASQICGINASMNANEPTKEYSRWGLALDEIEQLGQRLVLFFERFGSFFRSQTHNTSQYGFLYLNAPHPRLGSVLGKNSPNKGEIHHPSRTG